MPPAELLPHKLQLKRRKPNAGKPCWSNAHSMGALKPTHGFVLPACAGMATHLEPADQERMLALFQAFSRLDGREIGDCTLLFSGDHQVPVMRLAPQSSTLPACTRNPRGFQNCRDDVSSPGMPGVTLPPPPWRSTRSDVLFILGVLRSRHTGGMPHGGRSTLQLMEISHCWVGGHDGWTPT